MPAHLGESRLPPRGTTFRTIVSFPILDMSARRTELTRTAARLFAEKGYHGTSIGDLAQALGVQKGSLYAHIESKADLLWEVAREGAAAFHAALDAVPDEGPVLERVRALFREGREHGDLRTDLDDATAALLALSAVNWAYTWLRPGAETDALADRFTALLLEGMRGYATP